jgi:DNA helicase-2/ATP-dependent DNA helicase PcrA
MATVRFTQEQFERALADALDGSGLHFHGLGVVGGEYRYAVNVQIHPVVNIYINSSVDWTGYAADTGENSIRMWIVDQDGNPLGSKTQNYVTRVPGWEGRMASALESTIERAKALGICSQCGATEKIFAAKTGSWKGRLYIKCMDCNTFRWYEEEAEQPEPVADPGTPSCPQCGGRMVKRNGRYGEFWGCAKFPKCRGSRDLEEGEQPKVVIKVKEEAANKPRTFVPSKYQQAIFDDVKVWQPGQHRVVRACAGSGKTTTGEKMINYLPADAERILMVAYNTHIAKELHRRLGHKATCTTTHSFGFSILREQFNLTTDDVDGSNVYNLFKAVCDWDTYKHLYSAVKQLVSLVKATITTGEFSDERLQAIADRYGILLNGEGEMTFTLVRAVLERTLMLAYRPGGPSVIDFDDMIWLPLVLELPVPTYDFIFADEAQDLNKAQIELILKAAGPNSRIFAVGDDFQSMYGFRGADTDAIPNIIEQLAAEVMPLSITYRCPKSVVAKVNATFPEIPFEAADWADEGKVEVVNSIWHVDPKPGDMVLCRTNAPLVAPAFALIRRGIKAVIVGRDIGKGLEALIDKMKADTLVNLLQRLYDYEAEEVAKLLAAEKRTSAQTLRDQVETIVAISDGCHSINEVKHKIGQVFSDTVEGVVFSTVHRAKGLEADRVAILEPHLIPHPMASQDWELDQERNIGYVAMSRAKKELYLIGGEMGFAQAYLGEED